MSARRYAKARKPKGRYKSGLEERYAAHLEMLTRAGEIRGWGYEAYNLRLGKGATYTPDFHVIEDDWTLTFHETKGFWREAARVRIKVAADAFPQHRFVGVRWIKGEWEYEEFGE